jgi:hypothetical protein
VHLCYLLVVRSGGGIVALNVLHDGQSKREQVRPASTGEYALDDNDTNS